MSPIPETRTGRLWLATVWISGAVLALAIIIALGSTVWRLQQSLDLLDRPDTTPEKFRDMIEYSLNWTKFGLLVGVLVVPIYIFSLIQHHRYRSK